MQYRAPLNLSLSTNSHPNFDVATDNFFRQLPIYSRCRIGQLCQADRNRPYQTSFRRQTSELSLSRGHHPTTLGKGDSIQGLSGQISQLDRPPLPRSQSRPIVVWRPWRGGRPCKLQALNSLNCRNVLIYSPPFPGAVPADECDIYSHRCSSLSTYCPSLLHLDLKMTSFYIRRPLASAQAMTHFLTFLNVSQTSSTAFISTSRRFRCLPRCLIYW